MWTTENRPRYDRDNLRYPSDLTDAEWQQDRTASHPPSVAVASRRADMREVVNGVMYILRPDAEALYPEGPATSQHGE